MGELDRFPRPPLGAETSSQQGLRDDDALNLVGPLVDLGDLRIAEVALDREVLRVPVATEQLDRVDRHAHCGVRREGLRGSAEVRERALRVAGVNDRARPVDERARGLRAY